MSNKFVFGTEIQTPSQKADSFLVIFPVHKNEPSADSFSVIFPVHENEQSTVCLKAGALNPCYLVNYDSVRYAIAVTHTIDYPLFTIHYPLFTMNLLSGSIRRVAIVGGTHGNELTGIYTIEKLNRFPDSIDGYSFECMTLLANPKAIAANRRYIDRDLNRCFGNADLANPALTNYEDILAKEIAAKLGSKEHPQADVIIDLHTSTANMGLTILPSSKHPFNLRLAAYLSTLHPDVRVCYGIQCNQDAPMLRSLSPLGCTIEVGAIAQGILNADLFEKTQMLVRETLNYIDAENQGKSLSIPTSLTIYQTLSSVDYPRNSLGKIEAMIHPQLQFQDYQPLQPGDPMFWTFTGESIPYHGDSTVFPIFINEAAYYEKGIAMSLTEQIVLPTEIT